MFELFKANKEDIDELKNKIDELNTKLDEKENKFQIFLNNLHKEMLSTIEQHDFVNTQHDLLAEMVKKLLGEFDVVKENTIQSSRSSDDILKKGNDLISLSEKMVTISEEGKKSVDKVQELINILGEESKKTSESMNQLSERSKQIEEIVQVINSVSEKTKLLALNASIEAARAGEHGKGFAIVADEVKKLADSTHESTGSIGELTKKIQDEISKAFENNKENMKLVEEGVEKSSSTSQQIYSLMEIINHVQSEVSELSRSIEHQKESSELVIKNFTITKDLFDEANVVIVSHIEEADVVSKKLIASVNKVKSFSFDE